jgi:hypothetical protein
MCREYGAEEDIYICEGLDDGEWRRLRNEELHALHSSRYSGDEIKI